MKQSGQEPWLLYYHPSGAANGCAAEKSQFRSAHFPTRHPQIKSLQLKHRCPSVRHASVMSAPLRTSDTLAAK